MIIRFSILFSMFCQFSLAQVNDQPTRFDEFIHRSKITWAAYASDTFTFINPNLNKILLERLIKKEIRATLPVESRTENINRPRYVIYDSIFENYFEVKNIDVPVIDPDGNIIKYVREVPEIDTSNFNITEITQILYIEKGRLKSYIPWVTPTLPVFISSGKYIGQSFYFNTAYNYKYNKKTRKRSKLTYLAQTRKMFSADPEDPGNSLKSMYGRNLIETVLSSLADNKTTVYSATINVKLNREGMAKEFNNYYTLSPIYDSVNRIKKYDVVGNTQNNPVSGIQLVQDWYYDAKRNRIINTITEAYVFIKVIAMDGTESEPAARLKLVFK